MRKHLRESQPAEPDTKDNEKLCNGQKHNGNTVEEFPHSANPATYH